MTWLFDTNALSESGRAAPDVGFMDWLQAVETGEIRLSVLSLGEVKRGIDLLPPSRRKSNLEAYYAVIGVRFSDQILVVDLPIVERWATLSADLRSRGLVIGVVDEVIAATALHHDLVLVTRNTRHFEPTGCRLLSPWAA